MMNPVHNLTYALTLSANKINLLILINEGCPEEMYTPESFIRNMKKLIELGFVESRAPDKPAYVLTDQGRRLLHFLEGEFAKIN